MTKPEKAGAKNVRRMFFLGYPQLGILLLLFPSPSPAAEHLATAKPLIVDMIPLELSNEVNQDSEPSLSIDPIDPLKIVAAAFTPNPFGDTEETAPIFISGDGGKTWTVNTIVPSQAPLTGTGDITVSIANDGASSILFAGALPVGNSLKMSTLKTDNYLSPAPMVLLASKESADQPFVATAPGRDGIRLYLGSNVKMSDGKPVASLDFSLDSGRTFRNVVLERRATLNGDLPSVRPCIATNGTVYVAFIGARGFDRLSETLTGDIVISKDSSGGSSPEAVFEELKDPTDNVPGLIIERDRHVFQYGGRQGLQRIGGDLALAVDPNDFNHLYISWGEFTQDGYKLVISSSKDGGRSWMRIDHFISKAANVSLAITKSGVLGILYQQFHPDITENAWETKLEQTSNDFADFSTTVLARASGDTPPRQFDPYIGDYTSLAAVGEEFLGTFATDNHPNAERFPATESGPVYLRNVDVALHLILDTNRKPVSNSIDPFFFRINADNVSASGGRGIEP